MAFIDSQLNTAMSAPENKLFLVCFPVAGRAEAICLTPAAVSGLQFMNEVLTFPEFGKEEAKISSPGSTSHRQD